MRKHVARAALVAAALIGAAGLFLYGRSVWRAGSPSLNRYSPTIHQELLALYAPAALIEFARAHGSIATNDELLRLLDQAGLRNCWMVAVNRGRQKNGQVTTTPMVIHLGRHDYLFVLSRDYLHALAGNPRDVQIVVIPEDLLAKEPVEALAELLE
jgi:hypothetical protein